MSIALQIDDDQLQRLIDIARKFNVDASEPAKAGIYDLLSRPSDDFDQAARYVLKKNQELYRRLG